MAYLLQHLLTQAARSQLNIPSLSKAGRLSGFRLQPGIQLSGVLRESGQIERCAELTDQASGMPRRAALTANDVASESDFAARFLQAKPPAFGVAAVTG